MKEERGRVSKRPRVSSQHHVQGTVIQSHDGSRGTSAPCQGLLSFLRRKGVGTQIFSPLYSEKGTGVPSRIKTKIPPQHSQPAQGAVSDLPPTSAVPRLPLARDVAGLRTGILGEQRVAAGTQDGDKTPSSGSSFAHGTLLLSNPWILPLTCSRNRVTSCLSSFPIWLHCPSKLPPSSPTQEINLY